MSAAPKYPPADPFTAADAAVDLAAFQPKPSEQRPRITPEEAAHAAAALGFTSRETKAEPLTETQTQPKKREIAKKRSFTLYQEHLDIIAAAIEAFAAETKCPLRELPSDSEIVRAALVRYGKADR